MQLNFLPMQIDFIFMQILFLIMLSENRKWAIWLQNWREPAHIVTTTSRTVTIGSYNNLSKTSQTVNIGRYNNSAIISFIFLESKHIWCCWWIEKSLVILSTCSFCAVYDPAFLVKSSQCTIPSHDPWSPEYKDHHSGNIGLVSMGYKSRRIWFLLSWIH